MSREADSHTFSEHLPGQHDQRSHGRRGSSVFGTRQVEGVPIGKDAMPDGTHFNGYGPQNYHHVEYPGGEQSYGWYDRHAVRAERVPQSAKEKRSWGLKEGPHRDTVRAATEYLRGRTEHHGQEEMMAFDRDGRLIAHITGERDSVHPPPVVSMVAHTMLHTHPPKTGKATPSIEDAIYHNNYEVVTWGVVGPNDSVFFQRGGDPNGVRIRESKLSEHLPGKHDQRSHGRRGTGGPGGEGDDFRDDKGTTRGYPYDNGHLKNVDPFKVMTEFPGRPMPKESEKQGWHPDDMGPSARSVRRYAAEIRGDSVENALIWDEKGNLLTWSKGNSNGVTPPGGASLRGHTMLHNHPSHDVEQLGLSSQGYGGSDLAYAAHYGIRKMVVTNKTGVFIAKLREGDSPDLWRTVNNTLVRRRYPVTPLSPQTAGESYSDRCMRVLKFHGIQVTRRVFSELREHLPGKHDQRSHGKRGSGPGADGTGTYSGHHGGTVEAEPYAVRGGHHSPFTVHTKDPGPIPGFLEKSDWHPDDQGPSQRSIRRYASQIRGDERENALIWDEQGRLLTWSKGGVSSVTPPPGAARRAHTMLHNHPIDSPNSLGFSTPPGDLGWAAANNVRKMVVATPSGGVMIAKLPAGKDPALWRDAGIKVAQRLSSSSSATYDDFGGYTAALQSAFKEHGIHCTVRRYKSNDTTRESALAEHLPGKHDQSSHGRRGASAGLSKRLGKCYEMAGRDILDDNHPGGVLVHGSIQGGGNPRITHAWVEYEDAEMRAALDRIGATKASATMAFDAVLQQAMPKEAYQAMFNAKEYRRYTRDEVMENLVKHENWGPWHKDAVGPPGEAKMGKLIKPLESGRIAETLEAVLSEHLPGKHDQKTHGRRSGSGEYRFHTQGKSQGYFDEESGTHGYFDARYGGHNVPSWDEKRTWGAHNGPSESELRLAAERMRKVNKREMEEYGTTGEMIAAWGPDGNLIGHGQSVRPDMVGIPPHVLLHAHTVMHSHPTIDSTNGPSPQDFVPAEANLIYRSVVVNEAQTYTMTSERGRWGGYDLESGSRIANRLDDAYLLAFTPTMADGILQSVCREMDVDLTITKARDVAEAATRIREAAALFTSTAERLAHAEERDRFLDPMMARAASRLARVFELQGEKLLAAMHQQRDRIELATLTEHLPGKHDQKQHGRRGTGPVTGDGAMWGERYDTGVKAGDVYQYVPKHGNFVNTVRIHTVPDTNMPPPVESKTAFHPDKDGPSARSIRRVGQQIRSEPNENAIVWDEKGRLLTWSVGSQSSVSVPQGAAVKAHTMIHNHPRQPDQPGLDALGLSGGDLHFAANHNIRKMVVVAPQGTVTARLAEGVSPTAWSRAAYKVNDLFNLPPTTSIAELSLGIMKEHGIQVTRRVFADVREAGELAALSEHLPGQHDQKSHGRRGSAGGGGSSEVITDITQELPEGFEWYHGINANTGVHTTGYVKKGLSEEGSPNFKGLDNRKLDDPDLQRKLDAVGDGIRNKTIEHSVQFDRDGNQISLTSGTEVEVSPPSRASMAALVSMHNHPNDSPPSVQDFIHSTAYNHREVRIVGPTNTYIVRPGPTNPLWGDMASAYNERIERHRDSIAWKNATATGQRYGMVEGALKAACEEQGFQLTISRLKESALLEALRTDADSRILRILDSVEFDTRSMFESILKEERVRARVLGRAMQYPTTGIGIAFGLPNPRAEEYASKRAAELVTRINETTRKDIQKMVTQAVGSGQSYDDLARDLRRKYTEFGVKKPQHHIRDRATLIAVTEMGQAYEQGVKDAGEYLASGGVPMMKFWQTVGDERRCPTCAGNEDAGWLPLDDEFPSGHDRPLAHPGCRCALLQRVYDPDDMPESYRPVGYDTYMADYDHQAALASAYFVGRLKVPRYPRLSKYGGWLKRRAGRPIRLREAEGLDRTAMQRDMAVLGDMTERYPNRGLKEFGYTKLPSNVACSYQDGCLLLNESLSQTATARQFDWMLGESYRSGWFARATTREHLVIRGFARSAHEDLMRRNPTLDLNEQLEFTLQELQDSLLGSGEVDATTWGELREKIESYRELAEFGTTLLQVYRGGSLGSFGQSIGYLAAWEEAFVSVDYPMWYPQDDEPVVKFVFDVLPNIVQAGVPWRL